MKFYTRVFGLVGTGLILLIFALYLGRASTKKDRANTDGFNLQGLRKLPILEGGRVQPLDTFARNSLRLISGGEEYEDGDKKKQPAIKWLADAMFTDVKGVTGRKFARTGPVWEARIYRIENEQLIGMLGLPTRDGLRYSLAEFYDKRDLISREVAKAGKVEKDKRDLYETKLLEFEQHLMQFERINQNTIAIIPPGEAGAGWDSQFGKKKVYFQNEQWHEAARFAALTAVLEKHQLTLDAVKKLPADRAEMLVDEVKTGIELALERQIAEEPRIKPWLNLRDAYRAGDHEKFNEILEEVSVVPEAVNAKAIRKTKLEVFLNNFAPFFQVTGMYVVVMVLALAGLVLFAINPELSRLTRWPAFGLTFMAFVIHTAAIASRIYLQERPPVTNLYSSAIFIGWGAVATCMMLELVYSYGAGLFVGGFVGFMTGVIAHFLSLSGGDSLEMMQAVLDTNLWLATHVVLVTFGYVATYIAGVFGIMFILTGMFSPLLNREFFKALSNILYGVICFATMLSFIGTVLGGIWADQSWGRFWGWDPKENGAVLVVIWNTIILHARWAGLIQQRGTAVLAVLGNIVVAWSWFGTNMLGVGLHAYGFTSFGFWMMVGTGSVSMVIAAMGAVWPARLWMSYGGRYDAPMTAVTA